MKPQHCKAHKENDEYFCPWVGLRWGLTNEDYTPGCQSQCLSTTEKCVESDSVRRHQQELRADKFYASWGAEVVVKRSNYEASMPTWALDREASIIFFKDQILVVHPMHTPQVLHPGAKKFVDVLGIT